MSALAMGSGSRPYSAINFFDSFLVVVLAGPIHLHHQRCVPFTFAVGRGPVGVHQRGGVPVSLLEFRRDVHGGSLGMDQAGLLGGFSGLILSLFRCSPGNYVIGASLHLCIGDLEIQLIEFGIQSVRAQSLP
ncbi:hypothetical protein [Paraburkholderia saeva]|uniref:hypothetical protein n=1 Tax=Paraburkholderia saeva TaxID=2777537 RepID=UPI001E34CAA6|nr:hypothetical protein [Paraburkholderia saeva]